MVMKRPMVTFLSQLLLAIRSRFTRRARLEAENLLLRQQLVVLRRKSPRRVRLWNIDRLLLVWLYRLLKLFYLQGRELAPRDWTVMLDEAQDADPVILGLLERHKGARIVVGDKYQQLY
jgi:hypothetical protein